MQTDLWESVVEETAAIVWQDSEELARIITLALSGLPGALESLPVERDEANGNRWRSDVIFGTIRHARAALAYADTWFEDFAGGEWGSPREADPAAQTAPLRYQGAAKIAFHFRAPTPEEAAASEARDAVRDRTEKIKEFPLTELLFLHSRTNAEDIILRWAEATEDQRRPPGKRFHAVDTEAIEDPREAVLLYLLLLSQRESYAEKAKQARVLADGLERFICYRKDDVNWAGDFILEFNLYAQGEPYRWFVSIPALADWADPDEIPPHTERGDSQGITIIPVALLGEHIRSVQG